MTYKLMRVLDGKHVELGLYADIKIARRALLNHPRLNCYITYQGTSLLKAQLNLRYGKFAHMEGRHGN